MKETFKFGSSNIIKISMGSKAISPMIATVLLIAFTVAVGGILSMWLTSLASTQTETTGAAAEKQILCARSVLKIDEATFLQEAAGVDSANVTVVYEYGTENLYNFSISFIDSNRLSYTITAASLATKVGMTQYNNTAGQQFTPGMMNAWNLNITSYSGSASTLTASSLKTVKVVALCQGTYPISAECNSGQSCMA